MIDSRLWICIAVWACLSIGISLCVMPGYAQQTRQDVCTTCRHTIDAYGTHGSYLIEGLEVADITNLHLTAALIAPESWQYALHTSMSDIPYDDMSDGVAFFTTHIPTDSMRFVAEIAATTAYDIDVYVGFDSNGDGIPQPEEEVCASLYDAPHAYCNVDNPEAGTYWVLVHNWEGSHVQPDTVTVYTASVPRTNTNTITVTGPQRVFANTPFDLCVVWTIPPTPSVQRQPYERWYGAIALGSNVHTPDNLGLLTVDLVQLDDAVSIHGSPTTVHVGDVLTYTMTMHPFGQHACADVGQPTYTLTTTLPSELRYVEGSATHAPVVSDNHNQLVWDDIRIGTEKLDIVYQANVYEGFDNEVLTTTLVYATNTPGTQPMTTSTSVYLPSVVLDIGKVGPTHVASREPIAYTLSVTNTGRRPATDIIITDTLPPGTTYISGGTRTSSVKTVDDLVEWHVDSLGVGASTHVTLTVASPVAYGSPTQKRIVGGAPVESGTYPWHVALVDADTPNAYEGFWCAGSLIAPQWVLTAAHCVTWYDGSVVDPTALDVVLGRTDLQSDAGIRIAVAEIVRYPHYVDATSANDIALVRLANPATQQPIGLVRMGNDDAHLESPGVVATVAGWGVFTEEDWELSTVLHAVEVPLVSKSVCSQAYFGIADITDAMLCAGYAEGGKDTCQGDSGGALIVPNVHHTGYLQAGIVSFGEGCARPHMYGVYTRISLFDAWIADTLNTVVNERYGVVANGGYMAVGRVPVQTLVGDVAPTQVALYGPHTGTIGIPITYTASVKPLTATNPLHYHWSPEPLHGQGTDEAVFVWGTPGTKEVHLSVANAGGSVKDTLAVVLGRPRFELVASREHTHVHTPVVFTATVDPLLMPYNEVVFVYGDGLMEPPSRQERQDLNERMGLFTATHVYTSTGVYTVTATFLSDVYGGTVVSDTARVTVVAGPPAVVHVAAQDANLPADGRSTTMLTATVEDAYGNGLADSVVQFTTTAGTVAPAQSTTDEHGMARASLTAATIPTTASVTAQTAGISDTVHVVCAEDVIAPMLSHVELAAPARGKVGATLVFTATVAPVVTLPLTYTWSADEHAPLFFAAAQAHSNSVSFTWALTGTKAVTLTVANHGGFVSRGQRVSIVPAVALLHTMRVYLPLVRR